MGALWQREAKSHLGRRVQISCRTAGSPWWGRSARSATTASSSSFPTSRSRSRTAVSPPSKDWPPPPPEPFPNLSISLTIDGIAFGIASGVTTVAGGDEVEEPIGNSIWPGRGRSWLERAGCCGPPVPASRAGSCTTTFSSAAPANFISVLVLAMVGVCALGFAAIRRVLPNVGAGGAHVPVGAVTLPAPAPPPPAVQPPTPPAVPAPPPPAVPAPPITSAPTRASSPTPAEGAKPDAVVPRRTQPEAPPARDVTPPTNGRWEHRRFRAMRRRARSPGMVRPPSTGS